jgi:hypothetical protein
VLVWEWRNGEFVVRRAGQSTSAAIHEALFGAEAVRRKSVDVKAGIRKYVRRRHARD